MAPCCKDSHILQTVKQTNLLIIECYQKVVFFENLEIFFGDGDRSRWPQKLFLSLTLKIFNDRKTTFLDKYNSRPRAARLRMPRTVAEVRKSLPEREKITETRFRTLQTHHFLSGTTCAAIWCFWSPIGAGFWKESSSSFQIVIYANFWRVLSAVVG